MSIVRSEAVRRVDAEHGYTMEYAGSPAAHAAEYDEMEQQLARGHEFKADPTHPLSAVRRDTCVRCGQAVLQYTTGRIYGSAWVQDCPARTGP